MSFRCGRSFRLLGTECRPQGTKTMDMNFKRYDFVMRVVRTTIAGIAVSLWPLFVVLFMFLQCFSGRVTGFFTSIYKACIPRQYGLT